jgi:multidrug resistance efflux pump
MFRKAILPALALAFLIFAAVHAWYVQRPAPETPPVVPPPSTPFGNTVAGAGMTEPSTEASGTSAISIGSQLAGVVTAVRVHIEQEVKAGDILFELDKRQTEADLKVQLATVKVAETQLRQLELQPRPETVPPSEAQLQASEANLGEQKDLLDRAKKMLPPGAIAEQDYVTALLNYKQALAQRDVSKTNLALLKAGAWEADKVIAAATVAQARARAEQDQTQLELLVVRAPVDGTILQVNIRPGEYVTTLGSQSLILMGNLRPMHVRVNVDEEDVPRLRLYAPARAKLRGDPRQEAIPLHFVRLEPYVVPKVSMTGINVERVDTRVVQVIYAVDPECDAIKNKRLLVGQIVDVFIDTGSAGGPAK